MDINQPLTGNTFKDFLLTTSVKDKKEDAYGKIVANYITSTIYGSDSYVFRRNNRYNLNRRWANGRIDIQAMFQDRLEFNGKINYVNINWKALSLVNTIISRMVGRWMQRNEKISVTATDTLSIKQKNEQYEEIEFELMHREALADLEAQSGVPIVPKDQFRPEDKEELELWRQEIQRTPEEILYETNTNDSLAANGWFDVIKEKMLHDSAETGFVGTYTWLDSDGVIHVEIVKPENAFYSYSDFPDFRDTAWRGRIVSMKISEVRKKYGAEFGGKLTEEQIFKIAGMSKDYQVYDKIKWVGDWNFCFVRPYDEWNIDVVEFEVKTLDVEGTTFTKTKTNNSTLIEKGRPEKLKDNQRYVEDKTWNIYRGVFIQSMELMLEWGIKKNMIRPQDPKEIGNCEFSYSFYMYQNYQMRNLAVPEKIEEPVEQMILARLRIQQLVAKMVPVGAAINVDALEELDLGMSTGPSKPLDIQKIWQQTGVLYYRGRDAEGRPLPVPINELTNSGFMAQMQGLVELYRFHFSVLKDELGEDPNLMTQAATPRVSTGNIQTSIQQSEYSTDYIYGAYVQVMQETAKKMACLMYQSVKYGSKAYREIMGQENIKDRIFGTKIELLPTEAQLVQMQGMLNQAVASTPDLVMYMDQFKIMRLAKENIKLGELYFVQAQKKMLKSKAEQATKNAQENGQIQIQSAQAASEGEAKVKLLEGQLKMKEMEADIKGKKEIAALTSVLKMYELGVMRPEIQPFAMAIIQNVGIPVAVENMEMRQGIADQMNQAAQQPPPEQMPEGQPPPDQQMQPQ